MTCHVMDSSHVDVLIQVQVTVSFEVTVGSAQLMLVDREHGTTAKTVRYIVAVSIPF